MGVAIGIVGVAYKCLHVAYAWEGNKGRHGDVHQAVVIKVAMGMTSGHLGHTEDIQNIHSLKRW